MGVKMKYSTVPFNLPLVISLIALLSALTSPRQIQANSPADVRAALQNARASIAIIGIEGRDGPTITPSLGFVIGRDLIATIHQVVPLNARWYASLLRPESSAQLNVMYSDSYRRATVMTMTGYLGVSPLPLGDSDRVTAGDRVYLFADTNLQGEIIETTVSSISSNDPKRFFVLSTPINDSIRGGPVFNNKGEVIGILDQTPPGSRASIAIPISYLTVLVKSRTPEPLAGPRLPAETTPAGAEAKTKPVSAPERDSGSGADRTGRPSTGTGQPGVGAGEGSGLGPGRNTGTSTTTLPATSRPRALNSVRPQYTETARINQTMGVVMMRIMVGADGNVKSARVTKGLPDGLNEQAAAAAFQLKFQPATRDGVAVDFSLSIQVEFNLR